MDASTQEYEMTIKKLLRKIFEDGMAEFKITLVNGEMHIKVPDSLESLMDNLSIGKSARKEYREKT